jgi:membrane-bound ClpP family serine protease
MPSYYAIALMIGFYGLVVAEVLIPSGGLLGASALVVAVTSVIIGITHSLQFGMILLLVYLVTTPLIFAILIQLWPKTRIGRQMLNRDTLESESVGPVPKTLDGTPLQELVGRIGKATSKLLPSGEVKIDGHRSTAVSTGLPIELGQWVVVVKVQAGKLQVRQASETEIAAATQSAAANQPTAANQLAGLPDQPEPPRDSPVESLQSAESAPMSSALEELDLDDLTFEDRS